MQTKTYDITVGGKTISATFTDLTNQATSGVLMKAGETTVLITAVLGSKEQTELGYLPLSVEYEERFYAAGVILGNRYGRREGKPSDEAILSARIIDRTIRPLFPSHLRRDVQIVATVLAVGEEDPDVLCVLGTSLTLAVSCIPWGGPVGVVRIAQLGDGSVAINPTRQQKDALGVTFEVLACGADGTINMIETAGNEVSEADVMDVLHAASQIHDEQVAWIKQVVADRGTPKVACPKSVVPVELEALFATTFATRLSSTLFSGQAGKSHLAKLKQEWLEVANTLSLTLTKEEVGAFFEAMVDEALHVGVVEFKKRPDGRALDEVRPLYAAIGNISPVLHGSGIFYRGDTHILSVLTLGGPGAALTLETIGEQTGSKRFMHHYNFPPFSVGETGRIGGFNRRMIGHGALAEKALLPVIPALDDFPYTIRLVSETLASNGSSSMGSVCAGTLALMDGGVPIKKPVAGIASGVMMHDGGYTLLTDIQGPEDEHGDMDLKVAGTNEGITAMQMDVKVNGIPLPVLAEALEAAKVARLKILTVMGETIAEPRATISPRAPEITSLQIAPDQIGLVIGSGGKTINKIKEESGVDDISIDDDGHVFITGKADTTKKAAASIKSLTHIYVVGEEVTGTVTKIAPFGAFVKIDERTEGLVHISEVAPFHLERLDDLLTVGESVRTVVVKVENGKIGLSIKAIDPEFAARKGITPR